MQIASDMPACSQDYVIVRLEIFIYFKDWIQFEYFSISSVTEIQLIHQFWVVEDSAVIVFQRVRWLPLETSYT